MTKAFTILISAGAFASLFLLAIYPPVERSVMFYVVGMFFVIVFTIRFSRPIFQPWMLGFGIVPWLAAMALLWNGMADRTPPVRHSAVVNRIGHGKSGPYAVIDSWESDRTLSIQIPSHCAANIYPGTKITVIERSGALGIPWLGGIAECKPPGSSAN